MKDINLYIHVKIALLYLLIVAVLGTSLRLFVVVDIPATYRFLVHTHSHIALLGWVYLALTTLLYKLYLEKENVAKTYRRIYGFTQFSLLGMLLSFPFQGYSLFSIVFSTLFLIASYFFAWLFWTKTTGETRELLSYKMIKSALVFMVVSSVGPWSLGVIMSTLGSLSIWYKLAIYFYLHFQYNGWFIVSLLGLLFCFLEQKNIKISINHRSFLWLLNSSVVLSFALSVLWTKPATLLYIISFIGAFLQLFVFFKVIFKLRSDWQFFSQTLKPGVTRMLRIACFFWFVKMCLQLLTTFPYFADLAFQNLDFVIGYLHLVFLGVVTISLWAFLKQTGLLTIPKFAFALFLSTFVVTECLLFYKGSAAWLGWPIFDLYFTVLAQASTLFVVSVLWVLVGGKMSKQNVL